MFPRIKESYRYFFQRVSVTLLLLVMGSPAHALLINNGDGTVTDTDRGLMWLTDTNLSGSAMSWSDSMNWADNLVFAGYDDWYLPSAYNPDGTTICYGFDCSGSDIGHLFYDELGNVAGAFPQNVGPFENILPMTIPANGRYWTGTTVGSSGAMMFGFLDGAQGGNNRDQLAYAWAVRDIAVPAPASIVLFAVGLVGLGFTRKNNH